MRQNVKENWTEKHRNVASKIFLEGGWTQKRLFDFGWSDASQCQACQLEEGTEKHRLYLPLPRVVRSQTGDSRSFQEVEAKNKNLKEGVEVAKRYC